MPHLGTVSLEKVFLHHGYQRRDPYHFPIKHLDAYWYSPPEAGLPRIFISELRVQDLSPDAQHIIAAYTDEVQSDPVDDLDLDVPDRVDAFLHAPLWRRPSWQDYDALQQHSEYAAWAIYNRYFLNHFTISVHTLPDGFATIAEFNAFLQAAGFTLNDAGGAIKTSADGLLLQSATVANLFQASFADGDTHPIPGSYVEFAERRLLDHAGPGGGLRRDGFEAGNADKIFESTYTAQTSHRDDTIAPPHAGTGADPAEQKAITL